MLKVYLEGEGHTVSTAATYQEAQEQIPVCEWDLLLIDILLPDGSGWDLIAATGQTRPLAVSMSSDFSEPGRSRKAGYHHHLEKAFGIRDLDRIIEFARDRAETLRNLPLAS